MQKYAKNMPEYAKISKHEMYMQKYALPICWWSPGSPTGNRPQELATAALGQWLEVLNGTRAGALSRAICPRTGEQSRAARQGTGPRTRGLVSPTLWMPVCHNGSRTNFFCQKFHLFATKVAYSPDPPVFSPLSYSRVSGLGSRG